MISLINGLLNDNTIIFDYFISVVQFEIGDYDISSNTFIAQNYFSYPRFLCFHMELKIFHLRSLKYCVEILIQYSRLLSRIFSMLIVQIHMHGRFFHLMVPFSIFFFNVIKFYHSCLLLTWLELPQNILSVLSYWERCCFPDFFFRVFVICV